MFEALMPVIADPLPASTLPALLSVSSLEYVPDNSVDPMVPFTMFEAFRLVRPAPDPASVLAVRPPVKLAAPPTLRPPLTGLAEVPITTPMFEVAAKGTVERSSTLWLRAAASPE
jgi:hypothetical protein